MNAKIGKRTFLNVFYNIFTIEIYMKFILPCPQLKLYSEIHNTAQNSTTKCTTQCTMCCTIKLLKNWYFYLCFGFAKQPKNKSYSV